MSDRTPARIIGVPTDYGANRRGVDMGPSAVRYAGLTAAIDRTQRAWQDNGDITVPPPADRPSADGSQSLAAVQTMADTVAAEVQQAIEAGTLPLVLGGDHSVSIGSLVGTATTANVGVLWLDAHGDLNTPETSSTGNIHGMPLGAALGWDSFEDRPWAIADGLAPDRIAIVGVRDLDAPEREALTRTPIEAYPISEIDDRGITAVINDALATVTAGTDGVHLSLDLDVLDPNVAPGVGTPVRGGLTYREAHAALERVAQRLTPRSMDLVEVNPILDRHNETAELACELVASVLGNRIL